VLVLESGQFPAVHCNKQLELNKKEPELQLEQLVWDIAQVLQIELHERQVVPFK
jgi:hypothetical protein